MLCASPIPFRSGFRRCDTCTKCRRAKRAMVVARLLIEALGHERVSFITLTYAPANLPAGGTLYRPDLRTFLKRLRRTYQYNLSIDPRISNLPPDLLAEQSRLRFFTAGEYGERFARPHFHVVTYGADKATTINGEPFAKMVHRSWGLGSTHIGSNFTDAAANYCASYAAKGMTKKGLPVLEGRSPEFASWPTRPGLGVVGLPILLRRLLGGVEPAEFVARHGSLPSSALLNGKVHTFGRYLTPKLYEAAGFNPREYAVLREFQSLNASAEARDAHLVALLGEALSTGDLGLEEAVTTILERLPAAPSMADAADKVRASSIFKARKAVP